MKVKINPSFTIVRLALFSLIWWFLTDGAASSWWIGVPTILVAVVTSVALIPPVRLVWYEWLRFIPFFLMRSLIGGTDVAWRAFHFRMPIDPDLIEYSLRLPPGLSRVFMIDTVNLLPGTLSTVLERNTMKVHVLDRNKDFIAEIEAVEQSVARLFGISLNTH